MNPLHAQFIKRGRRKEFVVPSYKEFLKIQEELEDYHDLRCLLDAKAAEKKRADNKPG